MIAIAALSAVIAVELWGAHKIAGMRKEADRVGALVASGRKLGTPPPGCCKDAVVSIYGPLTWLRGKGSASGSAAGQATIVFEGGPDGDPAGGLLRDVQAGRVSTLMLDGVVAVPVSASSDAAGRVYVTVAPLGSPPPVQFATVSVDLSRLLPPGPGPVQAFVSSFGARPTA